MDDGGVEPRLDALVQEDRVEYLAGRRVEAEGDVGQSENGRDPRQLALDGADAFYLTTDGLIDQIGGSEGRSFGKRRFRELLEHNQGAPMQEQSVFLRQKFNEFQGKEKRRDDITVLGFVPLGGGIDAHSRDIRRTSSP